MNSHNNQVFKAALITKGRKTGKEHSVWLRAVMYNYNIYFSRRDPNSDWLKNALVNSEVKVRFDNSLYSGKATLVKDQALERKISSVKYSDKQRADESRVVLEVIINKNKK